MKQGSSNRKVNEQAREVIANALLFDVSDPRLNMVTITGCEVSFDRSVCNVFYTAEPSEYDAVASAFEKAAGHIRSVMARKLDWRVAPQLRFMLDASVDEAQAIEAALAREAARVNSGEDADDDSDEDDNENNGGWDAKGDEDDD